MSGDSMSGDSMIATGYAETMHKLSSPDHWDIPGLIADITEGLREESDNGKAMAVIDTLLFRMREIAGLISVPHAKRIDASTIKQAADIAAVFMGE